MLRWTPPTFPPPPQKWQSRAEILKSALASDFETELLRLRREWEFVRRDYYARKFDPNQPRAPAGNPDGGQWTSGGEGAAGGPSSTDLSAARRISPAVEAACEAQYKQDIFQCRMVGLRACYQQAALRYANCLAGLQIPPFNY